MVAWEVVSIVVWEVVRKNQSWRLALLWLKPCQKMLPKHSAPRVAESAWSWLYSGSVLASQDSCTDLHYWASSGHFSEKSSPWGLQASHTPWHSAWLTLWATVSPRAVSYTFPMLPVPVNTLEEKVCHFSWSGICLPGEKQLEGSYDWNHFPLIKNLCDVGGEDWWVPKPGMRWALGLFHATSKLCGPIYYFRESTQKAHGQKQFLRSWHHSETN